ncbi:MAG TPA: DUF4476 domain-containing protein [Flavisolibacter sp.]|jgi:hypothetical protein|nr:DUF4476 domain-containing protein [Flavisolibacter sp.]
MRIFATQFMAGLFSVLTAFAASDRGKLTIISHNPSEVRVIIDGKRYGLEYNTLVLNDIIPGMHTIKIVERPQGLRGGGLIVPIREKVLYNGSMNFRMNYHVDIVINRFGKTLIDEQPISYTRWEGEDDNLYRDETAMSNTSFENLRNTIRQERFTSSKMVIIKQALQDNYFTAEQVKQMAQQFSFEDDKLQVAKLAFNRTIDKANYHLLYSIFSYSSSKEDLAKYIIDNGGSGGDTYSVKPIISTEDFNRIKSRLQVSFSDNSRLSIARQSIDSYYFSAEQVREMVQVFPFEASKLEIAKYAYGKTVDKNNFGIVQDLLNSRSGREELSRYIANFR